KERPSVEVLGEPLQMKAEERLGTRVSRCAGGQAVVTLVERLNRGDGRYLSMIAQCLVGGDDRSRIIGLIIIMGTVQQKRRQDGDDDPRERGLAPISRVGKGKIETYAGSYRHRQKVGVIPADQRAILA